MPLVCPGPASKVPVAGHGEEGTASLRSAVAEGAGSRCDDEEVIEKGRLGLLLRSEGLHTSVQRCKGRSCSRDSVTRRA